MDPHHQFVLLQFGLIFAFVIVIVAIANWRRFRQEKLWHDTARLALEKGQPLPAGMTPDNLSASCRRGGRNRPWNDLRGGLVLIAVGTGVYLAIPGPARLWGFMPGMIGVALLVAGLIGLATRGRNGAENDPFNPA